MNYDTFSNQICLFTTIFTRSDLVILDMTLRITRSDLIWHPNIYFHVHRWVLLESTKILTVQCEYKKDIKLSWVYVLYVVINYLLIPQFSEVNGKTIEHGKGSGGSMS